MINIAKRYKHNPKNISRDSLYINEIFVDVTQDIVPGIYDYYMISNQGRLYHKYLHRIMSPTCSTNGYLFAQFATEFGTCIFQIHRLVMIAFNNIPNNELYDVNHKDGCKDHNWIWNLEWCTRSENIIHAYRTGLRPSGSDKFNAIINETIAEEICVHLQNNIFTAKQIAEMYNISVNIVMDIKQGKTWRSISEKYSFEKRTFRLFDDEAVHNICLYFQTHSINNLSVKAFCREALQYYGYPTDDNIVDSVRKIYSRKYFTNISCNYSF